jgi:hypothetical protein
MTERRTLDASGLARLTLDARPWLSCDDCFDLMDVYVERRLADPSYDDPAMAAHLAGCSACAEEVDSLQAFLGDAQGPRGRNGPPDL